MKTSLLDASHHEREPLNTGNIFTTAVEDPSFSYLLMALYAIPIGITYILVQLFIN